MKSKVGMDISKATKSTNVSLIIIFLSLSIAIVCSLGLSLTVYSENGQIKTGVESIKPKQRNVVNPKSCGLFYHPVKCGSWPMYFIKGGKIIYLTPAGELIVRSTRTGQVLLALLPDEPPFGMSRYNLEISIHDHYAIYPYQTTRSVYCVDLDRMKLAWQKTIDAEINDYAGCNVLNNRIYIRCVGESVCLDLKTGTLIRKANTDIFFEFLSDTKKVNEDLDVVYYENTLGQMSKFKGLGRLLKEGQFGTLFEREFVIVDKTSVFRTKTLSDKPKWFVDISSYGFSENYFYTKIFGNKLYIYSDSYNALIDLSNGKLLWCKNAKDEINMNFFWYNTNFIYYYTSVIDRNVNAKDHYKISRISMLTGEAEDVYSIFNTYVKSCSGNMIMDSIPAPEPLRIGNNLLFKDKDSLVYLDAGNKKKVWSVKLGFMPEMYSDPPIRVFTRGRKKVATVTGFIFYDAQKTGCYNEPKDYYNYTEVEQEKSKYACTYIIDMEDGSIVKNFPFFSYTISSDDNNLYLINSSDFDYDKGTNKTTVKVIDPFDGNLVKDIDL